MSVVYSCSVRIMNMTLIIIPMIHMVNMMIVMKVYDYVVCRTHKHDSDTSSSI